MPTALLAFLVAIVFQGANYAGMWTAEFKGVTFLRLELTTANGVPQGTLATGNVQVNKAGVVDKVEAAGELRPIERVAVNGSLLAFSR